jgi:hypothetical protein
MAISNEVVKQKFSGNGATLTFAIPFDFENTDEIKVYLESSTGTLTLKTEGASDGYDLTGNPIANVVMKVAPASGESLLLIRRNARTQELDLINNGTFSAQSVEDQLDRVVRQTQELDEEVNRALKFKLTSSNVDVIFPEAVANGILKWNSSATSLETVELSVEDALTVTLLGNQNIGGIKTFTDTIVSDADSAEVGIQINHDQNGNALDINKTAGTGSAIDVGDGNFTVEQNGSFKAANEAFEVSSAGIAIHTVEQQMNHIATPGSAPAAGKVKIYPKSDNILYLLNPSSVESAIAFQSYVTGLLDTLTQFASASHVAAATTLLTNSTTGIRFDLANITETDASGILTIANAATETTFTSSVACFVSAGMYCEGAAAGDEIGLYVAGTLIAHSNNASGIGEEIAVVVADLPVAASTAVSFRAVNGSIAGGGTLARMRITFKRQSYA